MAKMLEEERKLSLQQKLEEGRSGVMLAPRREHKKYKAGMHRDVANHHSGAGGGSHSIVVRDGGLGKLNSCAHPTHSLVQWCPQI